MTKKTDFCAVEQIPREELALRHAYCRKLLARLQPEAEGLLVLSRSNIYYLTGSFANGVLWLPLEGAPVFCLRKSLERARLESSLEHIVPFRSYSNLAELCAAAGSPLGKNIAVEQSGLSWALGLNLSQRLADKNLLSGDAVLTQARAVKTAWELKKIRHAGAIHHRCLHELLPQRIKLGMSEREISHSIWQLFFEHGHSGIMRMSAYGEEIFLGHVSVGNSGNYPSHFNGPLGLVGEHPAATCMGNKNVIWEKNSILAVDVGFVFEGYHSDKTQVYFSGKAQDMPAIIRRTQDAALQIEAHAASQLKTGAIPASIWQESQRLAEEYGVMEGYMGLGENKVPFLGHGIGLAIDEWPVLANRFTEPLETGMCLALEPKIGIAGLTMVGTENTFEVTPSGGVCLTGPLAEHDIICLE